MRLVNHGNELIHRIYEREKVEDLMPWTGKIDEAMEMAFSPQASPKQVPQKRMDKRRRH
jgi:hypothetical protein